MAARQCAADVAAVADYLRALLNRTAVTPSFRSLLTGLLSRSGRALAQDRSARWPAYVFGFAEVLGGDRTAAIIAAGAIECTIAAADVVDDLVDDDWAVFGVVPGRALNAGAALAWLAQSCVGELAPHVGTTRACLIGRLLAAGYLTAASGEDDDLRLEVCPVVSEAEAHTMTRRKAGALVGMACQVGAAVAIDDPLLLLRVGTFGEHVGAVAQLLNDIAGIDPTCSSDVRRRKKTLPVAYALRCAQEEGIATLLAWYARPPQPLAGDVEGEQAVADLVRDLGGLHYTWIVAAAHRREALNMLAQLSCIAGRPQFRTLRRLVPTVRLRRVGSMMG